MLNSTPRIPRPSTQWMLLCAKRMIPSNIVPAENEAIIGQPAGSRVMVVMTPKDLDAAATAADAVRASGAVAIFAENSNNSKSVEKVASLAGVRAIIGDEALYGDSLGEPGSDGQTYIGSILHNVTNLTKAWGGTVTEIPADLAQWTPKASDVK